MAIRRPLSPHHARMMLTRLERDVVKFIAVCPVHHGVYDQRGMMHQEWQRLTQRIHRNIKRSQTQ